MSILSSFRNPLEMKQLFDFTNGIDVDVHLARQEVQVQKAWIGALQSIDFFSPSELLELDAALDEALECIQSGEFDWRIDDEDIHMNLERFLVEKLGEIGKRVHFGRSRNDLIATTLRLFVRDSLQEVGSLISHLIFVICQKAESLVDVIVPGMTHLQHGQPMRFGHFLAAHGWAFARDLQRLRFAQDEAMSTLPLGSAALTGTTLKVSLAELAKQLGFSSAPMNSYDSVGDRDFMMEGLHVFAVLGVHLSRIAEDFVIGASTPFGLIKLPPNWSTGSSIMPNKRNPDVLELIRAKSSHLMAASSNALFLMKGLPTSYNSDLHEMKRIYLQAFGEVRKCLEVLSHFVSEMDIDPVRARALLERGHLLATEVANHLAQQGLPFREAYQETAALVEVAESQGVPIEKLSEGAVRQASTQIDPARMKEFSYESAVEERNLSGGTALASVLAGIQELKDHANGLV